ncbi:DUF1642 domain-containing protein [Streptococcus macedonicus]|uniref:DUF1642 domain-containing protein n=1 Tax=Streptococcus macedonicus TaxID=59310 RepID=UPI0022E7BC9A|nr:DUF1642 domain-containing protein [Streptococcus macedonicus]
MNRDEAVKKIAKAGGLSLFYAEDLYDSIIPKPTVPQYVADWYEENKDYFENKLFVYIRNFNIYNSWNESKNFKLWFDDNEDSIQTLVNMHQFGYEVEEEKKYRVILKGNSESPDYLVDTGTNGFRFYNNIYTDKREHTRKELEANGFGWVFDCDGIEVEEVE